MTHDPQSLRLAMRKWATGVTIVTAEYEGRRHGMTVSSFTSVSLDPPLILVSLGNGTLTGELIRSTGYFGVTILAEGQQELSDSFAGRIPEPEDRFDGREIETLESGVPFLKGGLVYLDCRVVQIIPAGTTMLYLGEVTALWEGTDGKPLIYYNREYQLLAD
jgi:flavin reductase (DIM6/NTAB) family NADH-FMN oxidoreductase RutF